ncbi:hypothetical protein Tb927.7.2970 [Trypanosoma brucei brucei TREU927]|uniref:ATP-dependent DEAD/H RNA helicase n=1 Tax=Trypanosoma brucei brucei (strain 927/4 GUTat10.1) TaxID=185431 RepID=Q57YA7_TRYB2|nr:hypothetical protein Tb927.7.2970 [Trypanosoma brucei brucei TREU927]AAX69436.1 hypothetical protein Tb927.7.2970 [Trypanosoma brucei]AAZ12361.1 hypothetical protein Tb927.7.2970 [Trypanosoma brucei brucei TREU927]
MPVSLTSVTTDGRTNTVPKLRPYQQELFEKAIRGDSIIYLPTGGGKTVVAAAIAHYMRRKHEKRIVFVVNRVPLVAQQAKVLESVLGKGSRVATVRGGKKSVKSWSVLVDEGCDGVVITDSIFHEWIIGSPKAITEDTCLVVIDEVHNATGGCLKKIFEYIHRICPREPQRCASNDGVSEPTLPLLLGLTASPVLSFTRSDSLNKLIDVTRCRIVNVTEKMDNLLQEVPLPLTVGVEYYLSPPEEAFLFYLQRAAVALQDNLKVKKNAHLRAGFACPVASDGYINRCNEIKVKACSGTSGEVDRFAYSIATFLLCVSQAFVKLNEVSLGSAYKTVMDDKLFKSLQESPESAELVVPILEGLMKLLRESRHKYPERDPGQDDSSVGFDPFEVSSRVQFLLQLLSWIGKHVEANHVEVAGIIFCDTRASVFRITEAIEKIPTLSSLYKPRALVGKGKTLVDGEEKGMTDAQQRDVIDEFRKGNTRLLVATSLAEEGLDIAQCNLVIRYDSCVSLRSFVQSRGRARRRNALFIVFEHARREIKVAAVAMKAVRLQDFLVNAVRDAIEVGTRRAPRVWEESPKFWLRRFERRHNAPIERKETDCRTDFGSHTHPFIVELTVTIPNNSSPEKIVIPKPYEGKTISVKASGGRVKARQYAEYQLCEELDKRGILIGEDGERARSISTMKMLSNGILVCEEGSLSTSELRKLFSRNPTAIETYDRKDWGPHTPSSVLRDSLRRRRLPAPEIHINRSGDETRAEIYVYMRRDEKIEQRRFAASGVCALEEAAMKALKHMKIQLFTGTGHVETTDDIGSRDLAWESETSESEN